MKVKVAYITDTFPIKKLGREAWVMDTPKGLAIGNIYETQESASNITAAQLAYVMEKRHVAVVRIVPTEELK